MEKTEALLGAGCFWGVEEYFINLNGVINTQVGYAGGKVINPTYEEVCKDDTGHIEVVKIAFDPKIISYKEILNNFWLCHDPTQLNRQGFDVGSQYRSAIFYFDNEQKLIAEKSKKEHQKNLLKTIVTEILEMNNFYVAEDYHQKYIRKNT